MRFRQLFLLLLSVGLIGGLEGCGVAPPTLTAPSQPVAILFADTPPTSLAVNASAPVIAAVSNASNSLVTWSVTCGSAGACGSFSSNPSLSGGPNTYIAPSAVPSGGTVTVTATAEADPTKSVSATITITAPIPIVVAFQGVPPAVLQIGATTQISAKITNDVSSNPEVQWTVTCAGSACGTFNPTTTSNESPTSYTAPSSIPSGNTVTVTATSLTDSTKSASASIVIINAAPTLANGNYVFQLSGPVGSGPNFMTGAFIAQNGNITGGEQDSIEYPDNQYQPQFNAISGGSYTTTPDGNLQIILKSNGFYFNSAQTETLNGVIISSSRVLLEEFDGYTANGTLDLQNSAAAPSGGYAFTLSGTDASGDAAAVGGILNVDSVGGISGAGSVLDFSDAGSFLGAQSLGASTVSSPDNFGRVVFQLLPQTGSSFPALDLAGYIVDTTRIRLVETSGDQFMGAIGGTALGQGSNTGKFGAGSIAGSSYVFAANSWPTNYGVVLQVAGVLTATAGGSLTGTLNWNNLSSSGVQSPTAFTGAYSVDPTGRTTLANLTAGDGFNLPLLLYLAGDGEGMILSSDPTKVIAGRALQQQPGTLSASSFSGNYGLSVAQYGSFQYGLQTTTALGPITAAASGGVVTVSGIADFGYGVADYPLSGSFSSGTEGIFTGTFTGLDSSSITTADNFTIYFIDNTRAAVIETDNAQLTLGFLELQQ